MDVREREGLSGTPALNCRGERSAKCTSALIPQLSDESLRLTSGYRFLLAGV